jgi:hypothetical protein
MFKIILNSQLLCCFGDMAMLIFLFKSFFTDFNGFSFLAYVYFFTIWLNLCALVKCSGLINTLGEIYVTNYEKRILLSIPPGSVMVYVRVLNRAKALG